MVPEHPHASNPTVALARHPLTTVHFLALPHTVQEEGHNPSRKIGQAVYAAQGKLGRTPPLEEVRSGARRVHKLLEEGSRVGMMGGTHGRKGKGDRGWAGRTSPGERA